MTMAVSMQVATKQWTSMVTIFLKRDCISLLTFGLFLLFADDAAIEAQLDAPEASEMRKLRK